MVCSPSRLGKDGYRVHSYVVAEGELALQLRGTFQRAVCERHERQRCGHPAPAPVVLG